MELSGSCNFLRESKMSDNPKSPHLMPQNTNQPTFKMWFLLTVSALLLSRVAAGGSVSPSKTCYLANENIDVSFTDIPPRNGDTIDIVKATTKQPLLSQIICTSSSCPRSGTVTFVESLSSGSYQALLRRSSGPILATSASFRLLAAGQNCTSSTKAPTRSPTPKPTRTPTLAPILTATPPPTLSPTLAATSPPAAPTPATINDLANQVMTQARVVITNLVLNNSRLTPEFIRMGFHDCIHVCDGCIDLTDINNNGLAHPISVLAPVVAQFENATIGVSRADIWALASMVGADVAPHGTITQNISFTQNWFGRVNCENANTVCTNAQGATVTCSATVGPSRNMPSVNFDAPSLFAYFSTEYNLTQRQVVALMGAHTVGHLVKNESGINGPNGWDVNNAILQNEYYNALIGGATATTPLSQFESLSPNWARVIENNTGTPFPNINRWALTAAGLPLVMLDPDISLVRDLNPSNTNPSTGFVNCSFNANVEPGTPQCNVSSTITIAAQFSDSNDLWLSEFNSAMDEMLTNGYDRNPCSSTVCKLTLK